MVLCHISHVYETGCSLYFTVAAKEGDDPLAQWQKAKAAASDAIVADRRDDHPPPRGRHRPQAVADRGDRRARRLRAPRGEGRPRPDRRPQPGGADPVTPLLHVPGQPVLRRRRRARGRRAGRPAAARGRRDRRRHLLARPEGDGRPGGRRARARRRGGLGRWRRDAVVAGRRGVDRRRHARGAAGRPRQRLRPDARAARVAGRPGQAAARGRPAPGRPALARPARRRGAPGRRLGLLRRRRPRLRDRRPGALAAQASCSTPTPRSARWPPTAPVATGHRRRRRPRSTPPPTSSSPTPATTARACRSRPTPPSTTACSTWSSSRPPRAGS